MLADATGVGETLRVAMGLGTAVAIVPTDATSDGLGGSEPATEQPASESAANAPAIRERYGMGPPAASDAEGDAV
jgi:hypothetical protein